MELYIVILSIIFIIVIRNFIEFYLNQHNIKIKFNKISNLKEIELENELSHQIKKELAYKIKEIELENELARQIIDIELENAK